MPPYQGGGDMISLVTFEKTHYNVLPYKFEAGTPHIAGGIGLAAAIDYLAGLDWERVAAHEHDLLAYATSALSSIEGLRIIGTAGKKSVLSPLCLIMFTPTTWGRFSIKKSGGACRASLRHAGHAAFWRAGDHPGVFCSV
jgi:cysteine desulfurase/selenocysteine lyase